MKDKVIGIGKPKGVSKAHGNVELRKGQKGPRKVNGPRMPNVTKKAQMTILSH